MSTDKMREEFEAWCKGFHIGSSLERYDDHPEVYRDWNVQCVWRAWQASRAAVVVELPPTITVEDAAEAADLEDERAATVAHMVNGAIAACGAFIKAAGVRVK